MANNCWNTVTIEGKPDVLAKLEVLFNDYENHEYLVDWANNFFPNMENKPDHGSGYLFYGTKWWDFTCEMISDTALQISGDSAWGPPEDLIRMISEHYQVECEIIFSESGIDFAGKRTYQNGEEIESYNATYSQYTYDERGIHGLIEEYLYDDSCFELYETPNDFIEKLGIEKVSSEDMDEIKTFYKEYNINMINKKATLNELKEIETHLIHLEMIGLAAKITRMHELLSQEWEEELKINIDE